MKWNEKKKRNNKIERKLTKFYFVVIYTQKGKNITHILTYKMRVVLLNKYYSCARKTIYWIERELYVCELYLYIFIQFVVAVFHCILCYIFRVRVSHSQSVPILKHKIPFSVRSFIRGWWFSACKSGKCDCCLASVCYIK